jgi:hypothetical protein
MLYMTDNVNHSMSRISYLEFTYSPMTFVVRTFAHTGMVAV